MAGVQRQAANRQVISALIAAPHFYDFPLMTDGSLRLGARVWRIQLCQVDPGCLASARVAGITLITIVYVLRLTCGAGGRASALSRKPCAVCGKRDPFSNVL